MQASAQAFEGWQVKIKKKTCSFTEIICTLNLYGKYVTVHACARDVICSCCGGAKLANKSIRKILDANWTRIALHYVNTKNGLIALM